MNPSTSTAGSIADRASAGLPAVLHTTEAVASTIVRTRAQQVDSEGVWPEASLRTLLDRGLGGLVVGRRQRGLGHGLLATLRVCEILGRECASTALCFGMHLVGSAVISAKASSEQQRLFLDEIVAGQHLTTLALSEPGTGAHFYLPQTKMSASGDGFAISGRKSFVTNGGRADSYVVSTVAADPNAPPGQFSCVVIPAGVSGVSWGDPWRGLGMRGNSSITMELDRVHIPATHLLGDPGDQIWYVFEVVAPFFLMAMAGTYLGVADAALHEVKAHLASRRYEHSGSGLSSASVLQHKLGELWAMVESARRLCYHAAGLSDLNSPDALVPILAAKAVVADMAVTVANNAMTLAGGIAYRENSRLARCLRDARAAHVMSPTTDLLKLWSGRALLGVPLLGD